MESNKLAAQLDFILTCDLLKAVTRTTRLHDGGRKENSAEHSWHLALMALTLAEYAPAGTDIAHVIHLLLVHDIAEIGAGDMHFDAAAEVKAAQEAAEAKAARELFGLLPAAQSAEFLALWEEFEARATPEARFARAMDSLQPMLLTWGRTSDGRQGAGGMEEFPELTAQRVLELKHSRLAEFPELWAAARRLMQEAEAEDMVAAR